ncbi:putative major facilitator superfamily transporter [Agrobacterium rubi TR3 = NBRC 13261]|uniref:Putative major facilitator superfamily transporter n=1 Tax=Agrobacterium rubi TR3 = NBRC 13261 TaxID=1368415 RepID=A0A081CZE4_9HYPH|nr:MFS transporter [Agrobacterium rubi]MBP1880358.1 MFS family permease [Agrobacterium rubi]MCL6654637.1 transporter [Agrobacterium rubi]GAK72040.1 putative major facilitator superfamily transporter [Agrobacterium rubi TR3 = NBRC 13261]
MSITAPAIATGSSGKTVQTSVGLPFILTYGLASVGFFTAVMTPVAMTLAIRVNTLDPVGKGASLGTILGLGALFALLANPIFGQLSDRTRSRFGRRKPWLVGGVIVGSLAQIFMAYTSSLIVIGIAWCVIQTAYNAMLAALVATVPDQVPEHQRGLVSALAGMSIYIALLIGSAILALTGTTSNAMFLVPTAIGLVSVLVFVLVIEDRPLTDAPEAILPGFSELMGSFWVNPIKHPDFGYAWLSRFLVFFGFAVLTSYQVYYLMDHLKIAEADIGDIMFISTLITAICVVGSSFVSGYVSDRIGRRKAFVLIAAMTYALGIVVIVFASDLTMFYSGIAVTSVGFGVYMAVDQALVVDILPDRETHAARNLGVLNIANAVPQSIAPAVAPFLLAIGNTGGQNYGVLYAVAAVCAFLGALAIAPVRGVR